MPKAGMKVHQRKDGRWQGQYYLGTDPLTGKRMKVDVYGKTASEAKEKLAQAMNDVKNDTLVKNGNYSIGSWFLEWLDTYNKPKVKQSTYVTNRMNIEKHIVPHIGQVKLSKLSNELLQGFFNMLGESGRVDGKGGLSPKTLKNIKAMMFTCLKQAYHNGLIAKIYIDRVTLPKVTAKEMRVLTQEEHKALFEA